MVDREAGEVPVPLASSTNRAAVPIRPLNDPAQYDDLAAQWWEPRGGFVGLHWLAAARSRLLPAAPACGGTLLDVACGGGLFAPYVARAGYRHVGVDLSSTAVPIARAHGVTAMRADVRHLPFPDGAFDVVVAGEVLEHVPGLPAVVAEVTRVLRPGGTLVIDTIARTLFGRLTAVTLAERVPAGPPPRLHDPQLFVDRRELRRCAAAAGVELRLVGLRPSLLDYAGWLRGRRSEVRFLPTPVTAGLFAAVGVKGRR